MAPIYQTIIDSIINKIRSEDYKEGEKLPSESQLVTEFNTSRITVTRALKELELTGVIYREKGRGSFVARKSVKSNNVISLIIPHKADFFSGGQQYIRSVYKYCQKMGYLCSVHYSQQSSKKERAILEDVISHQVAGIILYPIDSKNIDIISRILIKNCPIVLLDRKLFDNISYLTEDELILTSVEQEFDQIGKACVDLLCDQIDSGKGESPSIIVPTTLKMGKLWLKSDFVKVFFIT